MKITKSYDDYNNLNFDIQLNILDMLKLVLVGRLKMCTVKVRFWHY